MKLVIIAGGKGTRLGLADIPKPMVKIGDKPLLQYQIELAKRYGIDEIFILSGHLGHVIEDYFGDGSEFGVRITHVREPYPLGTAGCVKLLEGRLTERFLVFYGDIVMDFDIASFAEFDSEFDSVGTALVHPNSHPYDSDLLEVDSGHRVTKFLPKPHPDGLVYRNLVNAAVYIFSPEIMDYIEPGVASDFGKNILPAVVESGATLMAYENSEYVKDMGTKDRFEETCNAVLSGKVARLNRQNKRPAIFLDRDGVINRDMGDSPSVEGFELLDGVCDAIKAVNRTDYLSVVVTNQPAIAKGFMSGETLENIHKKMETLLGGNGAYIDRIYFCPHHPEKGFEGEVRELKTECECRKPSPGMLLKAAADLNIDLPNSWMIGDHERDIHAGKNAGCKTIRLSSGPAESAADFVFADLPEAVGFIKNQQG